MIHHERYEDKQQGLTFCIYIFKIREINNFMCNFTKTEHQGLKHHKLHLYQHQATHSEYNFAKFQFYRFNQQRPHALKFHGFFFKKIKSTQCLFEDEIYQQHQFILLNFGHNRTLSLLQVDASLLLWISRGFLKGQEFRGMGKKSI